MMEPLITLGRTLGFSLGAGINLYATVAILGLASRYQWVDLPGQFRIFDNDFVIWAAVAMYVVEFFADKIPWLDTLWDTGHTFVRPIGGALIAVATLGEATPTVQALIALAGGLVATGGHLTKAGTRAAANVSPEPFSNWILSLVEDIFVVGLSLLAIQYPLAALAVTVAALAVMALLAVWLWRALRRRLERQPEPGPAPGPTV